MKLAGEDAMGLIRGPVTGKKLFGYMFISSMQFFKCKINIITKLHSQKYLGAVAV